MLFSSFSKPSWAQIVFLACTLRAADKRELFASHGGKKHAKLLARFVKNSCRVCVLFDEEKTSAIGGIVPDKNNPRAACVWMLTGTQVEKYPKAFFKICRRNVTEFLQEYDTLYNWVDARYTKAIKLIARLGGRFDGSYRFCSGEKFLFFTFRRNDMGGVMYAGKKYVSTAQEAFSKRKKSNRAYTDAADELTKQSWQDWQNHRQEETYIFRSAAEKNRDLYQAARAELATQEAALAKRGITQSSATAQVLKEKSALRAALQHEQNLRNTQETLLQKQKEAENLRATQREKISASRKAANAKSKLWKISKQLFSWLS